MLQIAARCLLDLASRRRTGGIIINEHTLTREQVRLHVEVLRQTFGFVALDELPSRLAQPGDRPFCLLTFDDGKRSNATEVAPELERLGVPAVFYVTTDFLTNGTALWFDRQKQLVRALGHCPPGLELETLKKLPFEALNKRLDGACARNGTAPELSDDDVRPMSWDDVRRLNRRGFAFGAHGCTHAILTRETREQACAEIKDSLARVSAELGAPCTTFAFPNGNYTEDLASYAVRCGADTVMTTDPTWVNGASALSRLPRIQLFGTFSPAQIELKIALAALGFVLRNPNGEG